MEPLTLRRHALWNLIRDLRFEVGAQLLGAVNSLLNELPPEKMEFGPTRH